MQGTWVPSPLSSGMVLPLQILHCSPKPLAHLLLVSPLPLPSLKCTVSRTSLDPKKTEERETPCPKCSPVKCGLLYAAACITGCLEKCEAAYKSQRNVLNFSQRWMCPKYITRKLWTDAISVYLYTSFQWQHLWACAGWGWTFSPSHPTLNTSSLVCVHVSLRKAAVPSTQLKGEDRATVGELEGQYSDTFFRVVSSRAQPTQPLSLRHMLLTEEFLPSSLSQLSWLGEESRAVCEAITCRKEHVQVNIRTSVIKLLCRGSHSSGIQNSPKWRSSLYTLLISIGLQQKESEDALSSTFREVCLQGMAVAGWGLTGWRVGVWKRMWVS